MTRKIVGVGLWWAFSVAVAVVASACVRAGGSGAGSAADVGSYCNSYCARISACDSTTDVQTCHNACVNANGTLNKVRGDVITSVEGCFQRKDCRTVLSGKLMDTCVAEAGASIAPSPKSLAFCDSMGASATRCANPQFNRAACLDFSKIFADPALEEAGGCGQKVCGNVAACVSASLAVPLSNSAGNTAEVDDVCMSAPRCPSETPLAGKELDECHRMIGDQKCGRMMQALLRCAVSHATCTSDGKVSSGLPSACKRQYDAAAACKGGDSSTPAVDLGG